MSKVTLAPPKVMPSPAAPAKAPVAPDPESDTEIAVSISLKKVLEVQNRIQSTLGITLPLSTFIARATEVANDDLPRSTNATPTADELFNQVLGLDKIKPKTSQGNFIPQITALPSSPRSRPSARPQERIDIIDILTGSSTPSRQTRLTPPGIMASSGSGETTNVFSISVAKGEEKRARVFLERVKTILQVEPGRLVL